MAEVSDLTCNSSTDALISAAVKSALAEIRATERGRIRPIPGEKVDRLSYTINEACTALGIGRTSLYELVKSGELTLVKVAGRSLIRRAELERLLGLNQQSTA
jgi:excisionase family DNA binding protein